VPDRVTCGLAQGLGRVHDALLPLDFVATLRPSADGEGVVTSTTGAQRELETDPEMGGVTGGTPAHFLDASSVPQRVVERVPERVGDEPERVEEVALPGAVGPHEEREGAEADIARRDALVVLESDAR